jgi:Methyltransferase FkbM domain
MTPELLVYSYLFVAKLLAKIRIFPTVLTDKEDLESLLAKLYPSSTGKDIPLIRFGSKGDGGYLIPNALAGIEACFSPGVSSVSEFEKDCAELGMQVFLADKSVSGPAYNHNLFKFKKKFIGAIENEDFMTLENWVDSSLPDNSSDLLLQIDIEGYEYEVFLSTPRNVMQRFRIIVGEFHKLDQLWNKAFFRIASSAFEKILQTHSCVHIHPNNACAPIKLDGLIIPPVMEFTFLRKDHIAEFSYQTSFPHPLDHDNTSRKTLILPSCWYGKQ